MELREPHLGLKELYNILRELDQAGYFQRDRQRERERERQRQRQTDRQTDEN